MTSPLRELTRAAGSLGTLHAGSMGLTFVVGILLARTLGPADYGVYAFAMAITSFAGMVVEFGLPVLAMREFSRARGTGNYGEAKGFLRWADLVIIALSVALIAVYLILRNVAAFERQPALMLTLLWGVVLIPLSALAKVRGLALLGMGFTFSGQFAVLIARPAIFAAVLVLFWLAGRKATPSDAMSAQVFGAGVALAVVAILFRRYRPAQLRQADARKRSRDWVASAVPMGANEGLRLMQGQTSLFLLGIMATSSAVGFYRVAEASSVLVLVPTTIFNIVAGAQFAKLKAQDDPAALQRIVSIVSVAIFLAVAALTLPLLVAGKWLVMLAFGAEYAGATVALLTLACGWVLITMFGPCVTLANMIGQERAVTGAMVAAVSVQLGLGLALIPSLGPVGAALALVAGQLTLNGILSVVLRRREGLNPTIFSIQAEDVRKGLAELRKLSARARSVR